MVVSFFLKKIILINFNFLIKIFLAKFPSKSEIKNENKITNYMILFFFGGVSIIGHKF
jgi:hypothetical protein